MEYKYSAMLYGFLDGWLFCTVKKTPFDRLDTLAFSGAVFNNCAIDSWLTAFSSSRTGSDSCEASSLCDVK